MITTIYLTRTGLLEPLGQSQVLPYLRGLARDYRILLFTCEKERDWNDVEAMKRMRAECETHGIDWRPRLFHSRAKILGPARDLLAMLRDCLRAAKAEEARLVHARSYLPAAIAWIVGRRTGIPYVFDMRALWLEERITAGRIRRGSFLHRVLRAIEKACLKDAAAVVSLTHAAAAYLRERYPRSLSEKTIEVIPTCADLSRFRPAPGPPRDSETHGCIGTVLSGWFQTSWLTSWFAAAVAQDPSARFEIVSRDDEDGIRSAIDPDGTLRDRLEICARSPGEMPEVIRRHTSSAMFFTLGLSKLGSAPTRLAEVLASGIPAVVNSGVGDVAEIVLKNRVGVVVESADAVSMARAFGELRALLQEPDLRGRCRQVAERLFSLQSGTAAYRAIYRSVVSEPGESWHRE